MAARILANDFRALWADCSADVHAAVERVGQSGWLILGNEVRAFEAAFSAASGVAHTVGCANGLDALEIALRAAGLRAGEPVVTTPLSAFATTLAIHRAGGVPVFVDVDETGLVDLALAAEALRKTSARFFVPVHLFGHCLDLDALASLARAHDTIVIEDCAQSVLATSRGRPCGSVGVAAGTSFYPTKNLGALGDGGALFTHDEGLRDRARVLRDYGQTAKYVHGELGLNSRLDELHAAILTTAMLPRLARWTARRRAIAARYASEIRHPQLRVPPSPAGSESVWHLFPLLVDGDRASFTRHLDARGVGHGVHYPQLISDQAALRDVLPTVPGKDLLPRAHLFATTELSIPIHPYLSDDEVNAVIGACNEWASG